MYTKEHLGSAMHLVTAAGFEASGLTYNMTQRRRYVANAGSLHSPVCWLQLRQLPWLFLEAEGMFGSVVVDRDPGL